MVLLECYLQSVRTPLPPHLTYFTLSAQVIGPRRVNHKGIYPINFIYSRTTVYKTIQCIIQALVRNWIYNFCGTLCPVLDIPLIPGKHKTFPRWDFIQLASQIYNLIRSR